MLKEQGQILYIRPQRLESLIVFSSVRVFGHNENNWIQGLTLLTSQPVKIDDHNDQAAGDDSLPEWIHIQ